ncbi:TRAP transporter large permease subunit [Uliginosibacterium sp. 31-16]|uniref:TRAP transporter large permease n=1 Tax=Uliginosibacterium sp. 31-16 TaxID=3068315 RepID=UPI00273E2E6E|nr:TRAP transporter large permease subunit [Uliginosibacterium sp. 31-16]MDP5240534.1 TRAP transporter large permease subunit [Uliginosibacterium sp. 31-16]
MIAFIVDNMAPLMFATMVLFLLLGYPVAFALGACGVVFGLIGIATGMIPAALFGALPDRIWGVMSNDTMLALPFFTFMGLILERSGMAEDLLETIGQLFGPIRGGLAFAVIFVGAMLAATTGVVAASVISMGLISLPIMLRYGYNKQLASGVIAASGTLAQIIPPSLVLIVLADQLGKPVGDMYRAAFVPGLVLTGLYVAYVAGVAMFKPGWAPAIPVEARTFREANGRSGILSLLGLSALAGIATYFFAQSSWPLSLIVTLSKGSVTEVANDALIVLSLCAWMAAAFCVAGLHRVLKLRLLSRMAEQFTFVLVPPLGLIFLVLGTIFLGIATPTEGGAMGATAALVMALVRKRLNLGLLKQAMESTARLTSFAVFILVGARVFSLVFYGVNGHLWVEHLLSGLPGGQIGFLIVVNLLVFALAFFLDYFELAFIIIPLLAPVAEKLGIDLIWFGVLLAINMQTSFLHPPFGFALFFLRSVAPATVRTAEIYLGAIPFVLIQMLMVGLVIVFPQLVSVGLGEVKKIDIDQVQIDIPMGDQSEQSVDDLLQQQLEGGSPQSAPAGGDPLEDAIQRQMQQESGK